jgi:AraC-like DNA-binding protein
MSKVVHIETIHDLHRMLGFEKPKHPMISFIDFKQLPDWDSSADHKISHGYYCIVNKKAKGGFIYGQSKFDFKEGSMIFTAPNQVVSYNEDFEILEGWGLYFHPDLLLDSPLAKNINNFNFFNYNLNEALHISEIEKKNIEDCVNKITHEYSNNIDKHSQELILHNLELLLKYCNRYYDRQFYTRTKINNDIIVRFEEQLNGYFAQENLIELGIPSVAYFAEQLTLSPNYLADVLKKYTEKSPIEFIHQKLIDKAKSLIMGTNLNISEIAYDLGFEYPSHFTKLFKKKTGVSPKEFRDAKI